MAEKKTKKKSKDNANIKSGNLMSGNVKVTTYKHGKKVQEVVSHNTGTIFLCDYIARALTGNYVIAERPYIIIPCSIDSNKKLVPIGNGSPCVDSKIGVSADSWATEEDDGGYCSAVLTFNIPSSIVSGEKIAGFILYSKDDKRKKYAEVNWGQAILEPEGDTNIKVVWTLYISYRWNIDTSAS